MVVTNGVAHAAATETAAAVLVLPVGRSVLRTLVETAEREGLDVNSLATALLMLGMGRQAAYVATRRSHASTSTVRETVADDAPDTPVRVVCINCGRPRPDPSQTRCSTCGGSWCTSFG